MDFAGAPTPTTAASTGDRSGMRRQQLLPVAEARATFTVTAPRADPDPEPVPDADCQADAHADPGADRDADRRA